MIASLVMLIVWIIIIGVIIGLLIYLVDNITFIDPEFRQVARTLIIVVGVLILILLLLNFLGVLGPVGAPPSLSFLKGGLHALWVS